MFLRLIPKGFGFCRKNDGRLLTEDRNGRELKLRL